MVMKATENRRDMMAPNCLQLRLAGVKPNSDAMRIMISA
jgi:hypothetical protein